MKRLLPVVAMVVVAACVDNPDTHEPTAADAGHTADAAVEYDENQCGVSYGEPTRAVIRELIFVEQEGGVTKGLNLDGRVSDGRDEQGCQKPDLRDEEGNKGIDNQFAHIVPALIAFGGDGVTSAIQRAINEGDVLLMVSMDRVDDWQADQCVEVELFRAEGRPTVGGLGLIEPGQTFDRDHEQPASFVPDATIEGGRVTAGPVSLGLPMEISQFDLFLSIEDATLQYTVDEDGSFRGFIAGALVVDEVLAILDEIEDGTELLDGIRKVIVDNADLEPDDSGECQKLSLAVEFRAAPAFLFDGSSD
jgi:hypothetical protein